MTSDERPLTDEQSEQWDQVLLLIDEERWADALPRAERLAETGRADSFMLLGLVIEESGDLATAKQWYRKAADLGDADGMLQVAFDQLDDDDFDAAVAWATRARDAGSRQAAAVLAVWAYEDTQDPELEGDLRAGLDIYDSARATLAELLIDTGRKDEALALLREGDALGEEVCLVPLANLLIDEYGRPDEAEGILRRASAQDDAHASFNLALLLLDNGDKAEGIEFLKLAIDQGDPTGEELLAELEGR